MTAKRQGWWCYILLMKIFDFLLLYIYLRVVISPTPPPPLQFTCNQSVHQLCLMIWALGALGLLSGFVWSTADLCGSTVDLCESASPSLSPESFLWHCVRLFCIQYMYFWVQYSDTHITELKYRNHSFPTSSHSSRTAARTTWLTSLHFSHTKSSSVDSNSQVKCLVCSIVSSAPTVLSLPVSEQTAPTFSTMHRITC